MTNAKQKSKAAFDRQAQTYDRDFNGRHARALYPALVGKLSGFCWQSALDLGCGTGEMMKLILDQDESKRLTGLDLSEKMLEIARAKLGGRAALILGDSEHLPFADGAFDLVYSNDSFHHYPAPENVLQEVSRVLKPGGVFLLADITLPGLFRFFGNLYMKLRAAGDVKMYSEREMRAMLAMQFDHVQWEPAGQRAFIASGLKRRN